MACITDVGSQRIKTAGTSAVTGRAVVGVLVCLLVFVVCVVRVVTICVPSIFIAKRIVPAVVLLLLVVLLVILLVFGIGVGIAGHIGIQADQ